MPRGVVSARLAWHTVAPLTAKEDDLATKNNALVTLMQEDAERAPSDDKLMRLRKTVENLRDLELRRQDLETQSKELGTKIHEIKTRTLVDQFDEVGIDSIGIPANGNKPPYEIELVNHVKANLGTLDEKGFEKAIMWLENNNCGDMIKTSLSIDFGMGRFEEVKRKKLVAFLDKNKIEYSSSFGVPWNTLTAFVKGQLKEKKPVPLKLLGATVERTASLIKAKKEKKPGIAKSSKTKTPLKGKK